MDGNVQASITAEDRQTALDAVKTLKDLLPFILSLSAKDRQSLPKMDDARRPFVEKALDYGAKEKNIVPPYIDIEELSRDLELYKALNEIYQPLKQLENGLYDTLIAAGSDSYTAALSIYNTAKRAAKDKLPGAQTIVDDLKKLWD